MPLRSLLATAALMALTCPAMAAPLYENSVVSNDLDFILETDAGPGFCVGYDGTSTQEMADKRHDELMADGVHVFRLVYADKTMVQIWVHPDVGNAGAAEQVAVPVGEAIGKLPHIMRSRLRHVVIHEGDETAFAEDKGRFFAMYTENIAKRISTHDLQETVFHESTHATLDVPLADSQKWRDAQADDAGFVTDYAEEKPEGEDMAESALFAWALLRHPGRLPAEVEDRVRKHIPARLTFFEPIFGLSEPAYGDVPGSC